MGLFNNNAIDKVAMKLIESVGNLKGDYPYTIYLYPDHILIKDILSKKDATLSLNQITNVFYGTETEIIEKNKSHLHGNKLHIKYRYGKFYQI